MSEKSLPIINWWFNFENYWLSMDNVLFDLKCCEFLADWGATEMFFCLEKCKECPARKSWKSAKKTAPTERFKSTEVCYQSTAAECIWTANQGCHKGHGKVLAQGSGFAKAITKTHTLVCTKDMSVLLRDDCFRLQSYVLATSFMLMIFL